MEYNTEKNITNIRDLLFLIECNAAELREMDLQVETATVNLEDAWRTLEMVSDYAERAKTLVGKMLDEREDMKAEDEGE